MKNFFTCLYFVSLSNAFIVFGQDPHFSMFFANPVYLNPAYAGFDLGTSVVFNHHEQWPGLPDGDLTASATGYRTTNATVDYQLPCFFHSNRVKVGGALSVFYDGAGQAPLNTVGLALAASYGHKFLLTRTRYFELRAGWQASVMQRSIHDNFFIYSDQLSPYYGLISDPSILNLNSKAYFNHNTGFMVRFVQSRYTFWTLGVSASNLFQPDHSLLEASSISILPRRLTVHVGSTITLSGKNRSMFISPQFRWDTQADSRLNLVTGGFYLQTNRIYIGPFFQGNFGNYKTPTPGKYTGIGPREVRTLSLSAGFDVSSFFSHLDSWDQTRKRRYTLGFTYDASLTRLTTANTFGGIEINLRVNFTGDPKLSCTQLPVDTRHCPLLY
jgi:type IX secretion system PorP/SprF family membrane protein